MYFLNSSCTQNQNHFKKMKFHKDYPKMPLVYYQEIAEGLPEKQSLMTTSLRRNPIDCDYCGRQLLGKRLKHHINICQTIAIHNFCSKECKNKWCFDTQRGI